MIEHNVMNDEIMVSVFCTAYNHEKYIKQCLDGFVMQKTNFKFEVIVHDDASMDRTADIIREYEEKYPDIIKPIYQTENQYSKHIKISATFILPKARGKYIAVCEGDDYWCNENKLQLQYDAMERNESCRFCVHKTMKISENGENLNSFFPPVEFIEGLHSDFEMFELYKIEWPIHTSSYFMRKDDYLTYYNEDLDFRNEASKLGIGDHPMLLYFTSLGKTFYINDIFSCYRVLSIGSWSSERRKNSNVENNIFFIKTYITMLEMFNNYTHNKYDKEVKFRIDRFKLKIALMKGCSKTIRYNLLNIGLINFLHLYPLNTKIYILLKAFCPSIIPFIRYIHRILR